jgi:hypothetical protein
LGEGRWIFGYEEEDDEIHFLGFFTDGYQTYFLFFEAPGYFGHFLANSMSH